MEKRGDLGSNKLGTGAIKEKGIATQAGKELRQKQADLNLEFFREARFFLSGHRATLTFFAGQEVASIHYDGDRDQIFYKGHNVKNMTLSDAQWEALQKFGDYLQGAEGAERLYEGYQARMESLLRQRTK